MDSNIPFIGDAETCRLKQKLNAAHQSLVYQAEQLHDVRCTLACMESILAQVPPGHGDLEFLSPNDPERLLAADTQTNNTYDIIALYAI